MIIDTHTHVVPDKVAKRVEEITAEHFEKAGMKLYGPMTVGGVKAAMERAGIDKACLFCVAEKPTVVRPANDFLAQVKDDKRFILMGSIHPDTPNPKEEIDHMRKNGFKGIKFHSIFQDFYPDEERMLRIYPHLGDDFIAYFHMGSDPGHPEKEAKATPERLARVIKQFPRMKVVAAHFGGMHMIAEARKHLHGKNVYLDTCYCRGVKTMGKDEVLRIIKEHGSDKVLFSSDYPMADPKEEHERLASLPLSAEEKDNIFWRNAKKLFGV